MREHEAEPFAVIEIRDNPDDHPRGETRSGRPSRAARGGAGEFLEPDRPRDRICQSFFHGRSSRNPNFGADLSGDAGRSRP